MHSLVADEDDDMRTKRTYGQLMRSLSLSSLDKPSRSTFALELVPAKPSALFVG